MKKILFVLPVLLLLSSTTFAATEQDQNAADFLATKNIIVTSSDYKLDSTITRREMLKVMMNLSGKSIASSCTGKFRDLSSSDWGCKYAEAALANGYISANTNFRPNDSVTNIEALKMVMQARGISKATEYKQCLSDCTITDWQTQYILGSSEYYLTDNIYPVNGNQSGFKENEFSQRKMVFIMSARTFDTYKSNIKNWIVYDTVNFSISYPDFFRSYKSEDTNDTSIKFSDMNTFEDDAFSIQKIEGKVEDYISSRFPGIENPQFNYKNIMSFDNFEGREITIIDHPYYKFVEFKGDNENYILFDGTQSPYFETFYKSFQIK